MRYLYSFLLYLSLPTIFLRLWWKSRKLPDYRKRLAERLGDYPFALDQCLWIHAVSVGETIAAVPLIKALQASYPHLPLLITTMTPTGAARVKATFGDSVKHVYIPYDFPHAATKFLKNFNPKMGIIVETELWPNLLVASRKKNIPICVVNARLSEKSARGYERVASLTREMLQSITMIAAQGKKDAERFVALGAPCERVNVTGNLKFDLELPQDLSLNSKNLRKNLGENKFIWLAASTHAGEEEIILVAHKKIREKNPDALLILVPRHPDRFDEVAKLCAQAFVTSRRSQPIYAQDTAVYLADTMGELLLLYAVCDAAFVGGSLIPHGGHNILEAAALGKPILTGPHMFNFAAISELFFAENALTKVMDANSLAEKLIFLMNDSQARTQQSERALQIMEANRGALAKQLEIVNSVLNSSA